MNSQSRSLYRQFRRVGLDAVHYSTPSRYCILAKLDTAFRAHTVVSLPETVVQKTLLFLRRAAGQGSIENKIVRNICFVHWSRSTYGKQT